MHASIETNGEGAALLRISVHVLGRGMAHKLYLPPTDGRPFTCTSRVRAIAVAWSAPGFQT